MIRQQNRRLTEAAVANIALFAGLPPAVLARIGHHAELLRLDEDELLFEAGDPLPDLNIIMQGHLAAGIPGAEGDLDLLGPEEIAGLVPALLASPARLGVRAATPARIVRLPVEALRRIAKTCPDLGERLHLACAREADRAAARLVALRTMSAAQRLAAYLQSRLPGALEDPARFMLGLEKRLLAVKIGCSQENLSRAFAALRAAGVSTRGQAVVVESRVRLREAVGTTIVCG